MKYMIIEAVWIKRKAIIGATYLRQSQNASAGYSGPTGVLQIHMQRVFVWLCIVHVLGVNGVTYNLCFTSADDKLHWL